MLRARIFFLLAVVSSLGAIAGCSGKGGFGGNNPPPSGTAQVTVVMTDTPPPGVTPLSLQVTLTGMALNPGNVSLLPAPLTVEIKHLETGNAFVSTANIATANYTSLAFTFANPSLTFKNDTGATLVVGGTNCASGAVCQFAPAMVSSTVTLSGNPLVQVNPNLPVELLVDVNLNNVLSATLGIDFTAPSGVTLTPTSFSGPGAQLATVEGLTGQVTSRDGVNLLFTLQTSNAALVIKADANTLFQDFLAGGCSSANFGCVQVNQIVGVDAVVLGDGSLLAKRVDFTDVNGSEFEVDGVVFALGSSQFSMVITDVVPGGSGLTVGSTVTVTISGATTFDIDNEGQSTGSFSFASSNDLLVGQAVQVKRLSSSSGTTIAADRIRLRASRFTAKVAATPSGTSFNVNTLPALFTAAGTALIQAQTSATTEFAGKATKFSDLASSDTVSLRGQLFRNGSNPPALVAGKVLKR